MAEDYEIVVVGGSQVLELRRLALRIAIAPDGQYPALGDDTGGTVLADAAITSFLHIDVVQLCSAISSLRVASTHPKLRKTLNHAVRDAQGVATLPIHSVSVASRRDSQMF